MEISVLGFGGAEIGFERAESGQVHELLNRALDSGLNVIDTAECYLLSEDLIGHAVSARRGDFYLFTKCGHPESVTREDWRPDSLLQSIERSLRRLRTDYLDLIQLHSCSETELRRGDVIQALETARKKGYARYIGYSGDGRDARCAVETGRFDTLQISINIADQESIDMVMPYAREHEMGVIAKRPLANAAWRTGALPVNPYHQIYWERLQKLGYEFLKEGIEESIEIAMRFTLSVPGVHTMIVGTQNPDRWPENAKLAAKGALDPSEFKAIREHWRKIAPASWIGQT